MLTQHICILEFLDIVIIVDTKKLCNCPGIVEQIIQQPAKTKACTNFIYLTAIDSKAIPTMLVQSIQEKKTYCETDCIIPKAHLNVNLHPNVGVSQE